MTEITFPGLPWTGDLTDDVNYQVKHTGGFWQQVTRIYIFGAKLPRKMQRSLNNLDLSHPPEEEPIDSVYKGWNLKKSWNLTEQTLYHIYLQAVQSDSLLPL